ncbi:hypothetical protein ACQP0C_27310 [Nocardia sp. CA-129566]|uniref:hypothetical protein n=1 Tax=Nocardia sp. CA-129566 TaxID=3239976 RepID=UPI003D965B84
MRVGLSQLNSASRPILDYYLDDLHVTQFSVTSPNSAEYAATTADGTREDRWRLSWLPGRVLTLEQALCAMVLDEILIAHELDSDTMLRVMHDLAAHLAMPLHQILTRLSAIKNDARSEPRGMAAWQRRGGYYRATA